MNKRIILFGIVCLVLAAGTYGGVWLYKTRQNTSERVAQAFIHDLRSGNTDQVYDRLAPELKDGREQYWHDYIKQFKDASDEASLLSSESVSNDLNIYQSDSNPQRFTYKFRLQGKDYTMHIILLKVQNAWMVSAVSGGFVAS